MRAAERGATERVDAAVDRQEPVAVAARRRGRGDDRTVGVDADGRAVEPRVPEGEDAAVRADEPVPLARRRGDDREDGRGEPEAGGRAVEAGRPEREDPAVGAHEPVPVAARVGGDADDRRVQGHRARRAVEAGRPEGEDPAVGAHEPVPVAARVGGDVDDAGPQREPRFGTEVGRTAERADGVLLRRCRPGRVGAQRRGPPEHQRGHGDEQRHAALRRHTVGPAGWPGRVSLRGLARVPGERGGRGMEMVGREARGVLAGDDVRHRSSSLRAGTPGWSAQTKTPSQATASAAERIQTVRPAKNRRGGRGPPG
ncbi:MAG: hypothetical protein KatS3mg009_0624 [Acidimicrobiia bacterium]|nr:MAG: hypothetical protein KatS3mg009_0624 [Acidimicrobiia bacterium]